jgi:hypothetical protein
MTLGSTGMTGNLNLGISTATGGQTIAVGGSGGNTITIGNAQTAGSVTVGSAMTTGTITIGGTSLAAGVAITTAATNGTGPVQAGIKLTQGTSVSRIMNGAGVPSNGLAVNVGDIYINTTAASATTRMYICTVDGTWTNFTCAG